MQSTTHRHPVTPSAKAAPTTIETSLYDLIAAISDEVEPGEEDLVTAMAVHLLHSGRARFANDQRVIKVVRP
jgi:hypothetical protein